MANFCTKCGAELRKGEVHICAAGQQMNVGQQVNEQQKAQQSNWSQVNVLQMPNGQIPYTQTQGAQTQNLNQQQYQQQYQYQQATMQGYGNTNQQHTAKAVVQNVFSEFLSLLKKPLTKGKSMVEQCDFTNALILVILQGIISGLFSVVLMSKGEKVISDLVDSYSNVMGEAMEIPLLEGVITGLVGSSSSMIKDALEFPMFRGFVVTLVLSVALNFLLALFVYAINSICKVKLDFKQSVCMIAGKAVVTTVAVLVAMVIFALHIGAGILMYYFSVIWGFLVIVLLESTFVDTDKRELLALYSVIALLLFIIVAVFAFSRVWTLYLPDAIRGILNSPGAMLQNLLEEIM